MTEIISNNSFESEADSDTFYEDDSNLNQNSFKTKSNIKLDLDEIEKQKTIFSISNILTQITESNNTNKHKETPEKNMSILYSVKVPKISLQEYISRIYKYCSIEKSTIILSLIYIDRFCNMNNFQLSNFNIHKILFISTLIAIKYNEDEIYSNDYYAQVAGLPLNEINLMEKTFLKFLDYKLFVSDEEFQQYNIYLEGFVNSEDWKIN